MRAAWSKLWVHFLLKEGSFPGISGASIVIYNQCSLLCWTGKGRSPFFPSFSKSESSPILRIWMHSIMSISGRTFDSSWHFRTSCPKSMYASIKTVLIQKIIHNVVEPLLRLSTFILRRKKAILVLLSWLP